MQSSIAHAFGERVRELRTTKGLSQEVLAEHSGVHRTFIGRIERGETNITLENIEKLARGLKVPIKELFNSLGGRK